MKKKTLQREKIKIPLNGHKIHLNGNVTKMKKISKQINTIKKGLGL